jgi:hypothetical protein
VSSLAQTPERQPRSSSSAPSPPEGGKVRPEDVVFEEMDDGVGGIIIAGTRKPKPETKPEVRQPESRVPLAVTAHFRGRAGPAEREGEFLGADTRAEAREVFRRTIASQGKESSAGRDRLAGRAGRHHHRGRAGAGAPTEEAFRGATR